MCCVYISPAYMSKMIKLHFPKLACFDRILEPASVSVPFPQGKLYNIEHCKIVNKNGQSFPVQFRATALWPDGSVKWLLVHFQADLPGNAAVDYYLDIEADNSFMDKQMSVTTKYIDTGVLRIVLPETRGPIFEYIETPQGKFLQEEITPFIITDKMGNVYSAGTGENGWEVIESGPVRAMVRTRGRHHGEAGSYFDYVITLYAYAGKPWIDLDYRVINTESGEPLVLEKGSEGLTVSSISTMSMKVCPVANGDVKTYAAHSVKNTIYREGDVELLIDEEFLKFAETEQSPEVLYGTFYADWRDETRGIAVSIYQAQQNFPKRLAVCKDCLTVDLIPQETGEVEFIEGVSKTHRMQILFHSPDADRQDITCRAYQYLLPDKPVIQSEIYEASGLFEDIFNTKREQVMELYIDRLFDVRSKAYGMLHWGDNPDMGYTLQGRGMGDYVWINGEYDAGRAFFLYYITHGCRRAYCAMKCATEHILDVDICHHSSDPGRYGGQIPHSARHATKNCTPSHEWVEGLFDYYHETGDPDVLEIALKVGHNIAYLLEHKIFNANTGYVSAREAGWALFSLVAFYKETNDEFWLKHCYTTIDYFFEWEKDLGSLLTVYTDHSMVRIPFMMSVAINAMKCFYDVRPSEELKGLILRTAEDMAENCISEYTQMFFYKELPSLNQSDTNPLILAALTNAYILSKDVKFLKYGIPTLQSILRNIPIRKGGSSVSHHCMITMAGSSSNKPFAATAPYIFLYYKALMDNDLFPG